MINRQLVSRTSSSRIHKGRLALFHSLYTEAAAGAAGSSVGPALLLDEHVVLGVHLAQLGDEDRDLHRAAVRAEDAPRLVAQSGVAHVVAKVRTNPKP